MPSSENRVIIACAGSGKTTRLVKEAIENPDRRIAFVTYTINNTNLITEYFGKWYGGIPKHVEVTTWHGFLLRECARPYQHAVYPDKRIESFAFVKGRSPWRYGENDTARHYFAGGDLIYPDKIGKFILRCEVATGGKVTKRLRQVYTDIFIDECQDLAGPDLDFVKLLLQSRLRVTLVGDPRQAILSTNLASKNSRYRKSGVTELFEQWEEAGLCEIEIINETRRCNQAICALANVLWPNMEDMVPCGGTATGHDGVYVVGNGAVDDYLQTYHPQVLRYKSKEGAPEYEQTGMNFGVAKGEEWDRVLIVPTGPIRKFLKSGDPSPLKEREKLHVAITRARHSVAFVYDGKSELSVDRWTTEI